MRFFHLIRTAVSSGVTSICMSQSYPKQDHESIKIRFRFMTAIVTDPWISEGACRCFITNMRRPIAELEICRIQAIKRFPVTDSTTRRAIHADVFCGVAADGAEFLFAGAAGGLLGCFTADGLSASRPAVWAASRPRAPAPLAAPPPGMGMAPT
ncbi:hypothetical protein [Propionibacterium australiense]|uniref:hypothetical protein n=1 Tax=Propionibacterium australiense TaxID=119981 RepID=UPI001476E8EC|nr:hypothetical protein [Propionibacterium australiense]